MNRLPIRRKIALYAALATGIALVTFAGLTLFSLSRRQTSAVDQELAEEAEELASLLAQHPGGPAQWDHHAQLAWRVVDAEGRILRPGARLPEPVAAAAWANQRPLTVLDGDTRWRANVFSLPEGRLILAYNLAEADDVVHDLLVSYEFALPLVVVLAAFGAYAVARLSLAPIQGLIGSAEAINASRLDERVPVPTADDELRRLAVVINAMLARLDAAFAQAKRFAADASHELRTPLTIMRGETERLLQRPDLSSGIAPALASLQEEIVRLDRITEQLLLLARFEAGQAVIERARLDLSALATDACEDASMLAAAHNVELASHIAPGLYVTGDALHLRRLLLNLFDNATKYNHAGGRVECSLARVGQTVVWRVANTGPGIPHEVRGHVFERFHRKGLAHDGKPGHGLGLSLCREIATAHQGELRLLPVDETGLTVFELTLPVLDDRA